MNKKVSICIPTFNRVNLLRELIQTIANQTYKNLEVIITDNSDNELTASMIKEFTDSRIFYFKNEKNLGVGGNYRRALSKITGEYFTFTPDDDLWIDNNKLQKQVKLLELHPTINAVYSNAKSINYAGEYLEDFASNGVHKVGFDLVDGNEFLPGHKNPYLMQIATALMRTSNLKDIAFESFGFETEEYLAYFMASTEKKIAFIYEPLVALREAEHYRQVLEGGELVQLNKNQIARVRQLIGLYVALIALRPETRNALETQTVQNFLVKHLIIRAASTKSILLIFQTYITSRTFMRKFTLLGILRMPKQKGKTFG